MFFTPFFLCFLILVVALRPTTSIATVDPELIPTLKRFSEYSAAAYCGPNYVRSNNDTSICPDDVCPDFRNSDVKRIFTFAGDLDSSAYAIMAWDHDRRQVTISFRGTTDDADWLTNVNFALWDASDICEDCFAHFGFLHAWRGARNNIVDFWKFVREVYPDYHTIVTGHSLGGALAMLCAVQLKTTQPEAGISLFTYGAPRVGDLTFATFIETTLGEHSYRVTHLNDPVPRLPGRFLGFKHPYPEYHIISPHIPHALTANESTLTTPMNLPVTPTDILVLRRDQSDEGNTGYDCSNINMHDAYFIDISKCATGDNTPLLGGLAKGICGVLDICC